MKDYKYNRLGGVDAIKSGKPYTLRPDEVDALPPITKIRPFNMEEYNGKIDESTEKQEESYRKLNAFEYKGVSCSVTKHDQMGWTSLLSKITYFNDSVFPINFENENGNVVEIEDEDEFKEFITLAWDSRDSFFK